MWYDFQPNAYSDLPDLPVAMNDSATNTSQRLLPDSSWITPNSH